MLIWTVHTQFEFVCIYIYACNWDYDFCHSCGMQRLLYSMWLQHCYTNGMCNSTSVQFQSKCNTFGYFLLLSFSMTTLWFNSFLEKKDSSLTHRAWAAAGLGNLTQRAVCTPWPDFLSKQCSATLGIVAWSCEPPPTHFLSHHPMGNVDTILTETLLQLFKSLLATFTLGCKLFHLLHFICSLVDVNGSKAATKIP